jgi:hypothetical protein
MNLKTVSRLSRLFCATVLFGAFAIGVARAATFTVTTTNDSGDGSLRWAITNANANAGADIILFNIPGTNVQTIVPASALPPVTDSVVIDGYSQAGSSANTLSSGNNAVILVQLSGDNAGASSGLRLEADDCTVRGLSIVNFSADGIRIASFSGATITGNYIGLEADRSTVSSNGGFGINSLGSFGQIGGTTPDTANVIVGNISGGINLSNAANNVVQGNCIGVAGSAGAGNQGTAVTVTGPGSTGNQIGGTVAGAGNIIVANAGSTTDGVYLSNCSSNVVQGNWIGTDPTGTISYGNTANGIQINNADNNTIGGLSPNAGNVIAFNAGAGVLVASGTNNAILGNSIFFNTGLGIDLGATGVLANDNLDADSGANNLQNYPTLTNTVCDGTTTKIQGTLNSKPSTMYRIEFFRNAVCDTSGYGQGKIYMGYTNVIVPVSGSVDFNVSFTTGPLAGQYISATATDSSNNTSEFSACSVVNGVQPPVILAPLGGLLGILGQTVVLSIDVSGTQSLKYQWRLNGTPINGATNATYTILSLAIGNAGAYSVVVYNALGAAHSEPALVGISGLLQLPMKDNFASRGTVSGILVQGSASNVDASSEPGEPLHAGKTGGKSMWVTWSPGLSGIATVSTMGSTFDTLLAVYQGNSLTSLTNVVSDDESGGYHTSQVTFNAVGGKSYVIAVDGAGGQSGKIILSCNLTPSLQTVATVLQQPADKTVGTNASASFTVDASGSSLTYQWYLNGTAIPNATGWTYSLNAVTPSAVGVYQVKLQSGSQVTYGTPAQLQINYSDTGVDSNARAYDKFSDAVDARVALNSRRHPMSAPARGFSGTQVFSTYSGTQDPGEPENCGVPGGASSWFSYQPPYSGMLTIDTDGSSFDTLLGVYTGNGNDFSTLVSVACDNNSGTNGRTSKVTFNAVGGTIYYIAVDGVNGAYGTVYLHYNLTTVPIFTANPNGGTVGVGSTATLSATVTGNPTAKYQWLRNQVPVAGQTNTTLNIANFQTANEGNYQLLASNVMGIVTSPTAQLIVNSPMRMGSWQFNANQQFSFQLVGSANTNYVLQVSSNLVDWLSIATNSSANGLWNFSDATTPSPPLRFYRAIKQ